MQASVWVHGAVVALAVAQLFIFWYLYRRSSASGTHRTGRSRLTPTTQSDRSESTRRVACPNCGTLNTGDFRYCHECVAELPRNAESS